jgi:hypothetical protein
MKSNIDKKIPFKVKLERVYAMDMFSWENPEFSGNVQSYSGNVRKCGGIVQRCDGNVRRCGGNVRRCGGNVKRCSGLAICGEKRRQYATWPRSDNVRKCSGNVHSCVGPMCGNAVAMFSVALVQCANMQWPHAKMPWQCEKTRCLCRAAVPRGTRMGGGL